MCVDLGLWPKLVLQSQSKDSGVSASPGSPLALLPSQLDDTCQSTMNKHASHYSTVEDI